MRGSEPCLGHLSPGYMRSPIPPTFKAAATSISWEKPWTVLGSSSSASSSGPTTTQEVAASARRETSPQRQALALTPPGSGCRCSPAEALAHTDLQLKVLVPAPTPCPRPPRRQPGTRKKPWPVLTSAPAGLGKPLDTHRPHRDPPYTRTHLQD